MKRPLRLLVIGGVAAGPKAAAKARRVDPDMDITIVTDEEFISYAGCGLAYYIGGIVERKNLFARSPEAFREKQNIEVLLRHRAERINTFDRTVKVTCLETGREKDMPYDRLLIATGASPAIPPIPGMESRGVFPIHTIPESDTITKYIKSRNVRNACVIGGGYIGVEAVESLTGLGINCTQIEKEGSLLPKFLDSDIAGQVMTHAGDKGVAFVPGTEVERIVAGPDGHVSSVIAGGMEYPCELVIVSTGVRPNVKLAKDARIAIGQTGAIQVDERMETTKRGIFAAGDCVESRHLVSGKPCWFPLGSTANKQGRVAGANIAGGKKRFRGVVGTSITKVFDLGAARTGLGETEAGGAGFNPLSVTITAPTRAPYYPGGDKITLKLIGDLKSKKVLGAQAVGIQDADKIIDIIAASLTGGLTVPDLTNIDLAYSPPYSPALSAVIIAAGVLEEKMGL